MPWVDVIDDQVARPPRLPPPGTASGPRPPGDRGPVVEVDGGWAEIIGGRLEGEQLEVRAASTVEVDQVTLIGVQLQVDPQAELRVRGSRLEGCDLSRLQLDVVRTSTVRQCKLMGAELTGVVTDVEIVDCQLSLARFTGARLRRVAFRGCTMREVDFFDATLTDVSFEGCQLDQVNLDRARFEAVDLRHATTVDVRNAADYGGCVITSIQAQAMALQLASAAGFGIESDPMAESE
jgi:uncharacterized protein YjbI with pentapeptide repeats